MQDHKYNGWTNYETWCVNLWITNEEGSDRFWNEMAEEIWEEAEADKTFTRKERAALSLQDRLKDIHEENLPELQGFACDLLNAAMSEVNWYEIAENLLEEYEEEPAEA